MAIKLVPLGPIQIRGMTRENGARTSSRSPEWSFIAWGSVRYAEDFVGFDYEDWLLFDQLAGEFAGWHSRAFMTKTWELPSQQEPTAITALRCTAGISSYVLPCSSRPVRSFRLPPHCLKKKGTPAARHCL